MQELVLVLRRNPEVVRQNYLCPLMRDGRLVMTWPEEPFRFEKQAMAAKAED